MSNDKDPNLTTANSGWEEKVKAIGEYLGCNQGELWSEMQPLLRAVAQEARESTMAEVRSAVEAEVYDEIARLQAALLAQLKDKEQPNE